MRRPLLTLITVFSIGYIGFAGEAAAELLNPSFDSNSAGAVADGWHAWVVDEEPAFLPETGFWRQQDSGAAQRFWTDGLSHEAGLYQVVSVIPGHEYRFCAWMNHYAAGEGNGPATFAVGIDIEGGTAAWAAAWSSPLQATGNWEPICANAVAADDVLTVFISGKAAGPSAGERSTFVDNATLQDLGDAGIGPDAGNAAEPDDGVGGSDGGGCGCTTGRRAGGGGFALLLVLGVAAVLRRRAY